MTLLFVLSGATGLIYEVAWFKRLALIFGNTGLAQAVVLGAFLGGLALGNSLLGRRAGSVNSPLRFYGYLELAVAALGAFSPFLMDAAGRLAPVGSFLLGSATVLAAAALMGGTLPALVRHVSPALADLERSLSFLYFVNCAGATLGCLAAGFLLIPKLGIDGAIRTAAGINAAVGLAALALLRGPAASGVSGKIMGVRGDTTKAVSPRDPGPLPPAPLLYGVALFSGAASIAYESAWVRLLSLVLGSSAYSFTIMLASFITGISLGGWAVSRGPLRTRDRAELLGLAQAGVAFAILATLPVYDRTPLLFHGLRVGLGTSPSSFYLFQAAAYLACFALALGPAFFIGAALPLAGRLGVSDLKDAAPKVGLVFGANAFGNALGAAAGLWLMPLIGVDGILRGGAALNLALGAAVLVWRSRNRGHGGGTAAAVLGLGLAGLAWVPSWDRAFLSLGLYRSREDLGPGGFSKIKDRLLQNTDIVFYRDDPEATVAVLRRQARLLLKVNGKTEASTAADMPTQLLSAHLPLLLKPAAQDVLLVGFGSGITAGAALRHPLRSLDTVELTPAVAEAARFFEQANHGALRDPRMSLYLEDAKTFLGRTKRSYDLVISEPSNPWIAGVGALFSAEYYAAVRRALKPGGVLLQWCHLYEMDDALFKTISRTFVKAFPEASLWSVGGSDVLMLGSEEPLLPDWDKTAPAMERPGVRDDLKAAELSTLAAVLSLQVAAGPTARLLAGEGPVNTDLRPILEYEAPKTLFLDRRSDLLFMADERTHPRAGLYLRDYLRRRGRPLSAAEYRDMADHPRHLKEGPYMRFLLEEWAARYPSDPAPLFKLLFAARMLGEEDQARRTSARLSRLNLYHRKP